MPDWMVQIPAASVEGISAARSRRPMRRPRGGEDRPVRRAGLEGGVPLLDPGLVDRQHGGSVRVGHRLGPHARAGEGHGYGLTARMIAECTPSPACWAAVMV